MSEAAEQLADAASGAGAIETLTGTGRALVDGDWAEAGLLGATAGLEALAAGREPAGELAAAGIGWVLDHVQPLAGWFDELAGDPAAVQAQSATWRGAAAQVRETGEQLQAEVASASSPWEGTWLAAYRGATERRCARLAACAQGLDGVAEATEQAGVAVAGVRETVRRAISEVVAYLVSRAAILLSGVGTGPVLAEAGLKVAGWASVLRGLVEGLVRSVRRLTVMLDEVVGAFRQLAREVADDPAAWAAAGVGGAGKQQMARDD